MSTPADPTEPARGARGDEPSRPGACPVACCPLCLAVSVVQPLAPDVVTHVLKAGTELFLAFQALIDARGEGLNGTDAPEPLRLEKIDVG